MGKTDQRHPQSQQSGGGSRRRHLSMSQRLLRELPHPLSILHLMLVRLVLLRICGLLLLHLMLVRLVLLNLLLMLLQLLVVFAPRFGSPLRRLGHLLVCNKAVSNLTSVLHRG